MSVKRIAILGSTGSIGCQALEFIAARPDLSVCALAAGANWRLLARQAQRFRPAVVAIAHEQFAQPLSQALPPGTKLLAGVNAMTNLVRQSGAGVLLSGVVGSAGLAPTLAAIECGMDLAIANKETLVMAGAIVMPAARKAGVSVLPVDSEHSAIFQCLKAGRRAELRRVVITASGGALRDWDDQRAAAATVEQALAHPTWQMGRKITVDSATLLNKALEIIEAHWLFDLAPEQIDVVLHNESIMHSAVEFCDGLMIAQLSQPDMTLPIAYALCHPQRPDRNVPGLDLASIGRLDFAPLAPRHRRAVELGYRVIREGGASGAVLNAANETAAQAFLDGQIDFGSILPLVEDTLNNWPRTSDITLEAVVAADAWARQRVTDHITLKDRS